jgi:glucan biosynthesis protein C
MAPVRPASPRPPFDLSAGSRPLLACGVAAPLLALAATLAAMAAYPGFNPARQYLSELGGASAAHPLIFNAGVFVAGVMAGLAGVGFGLAVVVLARARIAGALTAVVFMLAGAGLAQAAVYPWPDPRHLAINLALGIQLAPLLLLWGLWSRPDLRRLKLFLALVFAAMGVLTVLTKHLVLPSLVNDANVGWWERGYAIILVGWVGVAAFALQRCLREASPATKTG